MAWNVLFFQTLRGDCPVEKFTYEQDSATQAKILSSIELLLYELRISGKIAVRIFYTFYKGEFHLLHAFKKKTEKTPKHDLEVGLDRLRKYI